MKSHCVHGHPYPESLRKSGVGCDVCQREQGAVWRAANRERRGELTAAWKAANTERISATNAVWYQANREQAKANAATYQREHREQHNAYNRAWRAVNAEKSKAQYAAWCKANPEKGRTRTARYRARKAGAAGDATVEQIVARWAYYGDRCWMCSEPATCTDHVKPLANGGCNFPANLRPACTRCNSRKGATWPWDTSSLARQTAITATTADPFA